MKLFFVLFILSASTFKCFAQSPADTIEVRKTFWTTKFILNGQEIIPLAKNSALQKFPESNSQYAKARHNLAWAGRIWGAGLGVFVAGLFIKDKNAKIPFMITGGAITCFTLPFLIRGTKHLHRSIDSYNRKVRGN